MSGSVTLREMEAAARKTASTEGMKAMNEYTYDFWRNALKGDFGPIHDGHPQPGYYRNRYPKHNIDIPVAIWADEESGDLLAMTGFKDTSKNVNPDDIWTFVCRAPISSAVYQKAFAEGKFEDTAPTIGHNLSDDPREALAMELEGEKELAEQFLATPVTTKDQADKAATWATKLGNIAKKADDQRKVLKQPHLDAGKAVDDAWNPIRDEAKDLSTRLKRHLDAFLLEQQRVEKERQRKAQEEADKKRLEAEQAAEAAAQSGDDNAKEESERKQQELEAAERATQARNAQAGHTGSKVALRTVTDAEITDYDALLIALKDRAEIKELVQSLANRAARSGVELPGMKIKQIQKAA